VRHVPPPGPSSPASLRTTAAAAGDAGTSTGAWLSIGALSRATGIPVETLRTWEARYGFPEPDRKPSGHRVYRAAVITHLRLIAEAISRGHRASEAVPASDEALRDLLHSTPAAAGGVASPPDETARLDETAWLVAVRAFDTNHLTRLLLGEAARLGPVAFVEHRVAPLLSRAGELWSSGALEISHEHFLSERIADVLRTLRLPYEHGASGPLVVFATLPGEQHALGLQMAALVAAVSNCRVLYLGPEVPVEQLAALAVATGGRALAVSVSSAADRDEAAARLSDLRARLPRHVRLLVGGTGAPSQVPGTDLVQTVPGLQAWARTLAAF
jgi:methylmalonyl-CoA mutase cobalamin-binding subunit